MRPEDSPTPAAADGDFRDDLEAVRSDVADSRRAGGPAVSPGEPGGPLRGWVKPGRRRAPAGSSGGALVYAIGDVHGRLDLLTALVDKVAADAGDRPHTLVMLGDYVDRGPDSSGVLDTLMDLHERAPEQVRLLKGNHEQALLRFIDEPAQSGAWLDRFGGAATLQSYGVEPLAAGASAEALRAARNRLLVQMPAAHLLLLQRLELMALCGDYAFVHAGVDPDAPLSEQTEGDLLWIRERFLGAPGPFEKIIVHGHTWRDDQTMLLDHRIGVDTGAYQTGVLSAVRICDRERVVIQALDEAAERRRAAGPSAAVGSLVSRPLNYADASPADLRSIFAGADLQVGAGSLLTLHRRREDAPPEVA